MIACPVCGQTFPAAPLVNRVIDEPDRIQRALSGGPSWWQPEPERFTVGRVPEHTVQVGRLVGTPPELDEVWAAEADRPEVYGLVERVPCSGAGMLVDAVPPVAPAAAQAFVAARVGERVYYERGGEEYVGTILQFVDGGAEVLPDPASVPRERRGLPLHITKWRVS